MKIVFLALALTACGTYEVPKTEVKQVEAEEPAATEPTDESKPVRETSKPDVKVEVETKVTVTVDGEDGENSPAESKWRYVERRRTYADAVDLAPEGYRLPTRLELLTDFMGGKFEGYTGNVWTSEHAEDRDDHVFFFKLSDGQSFAYPDESLFGTLYITKASDDQGNETPDL